MMKDDDFKLLRGFSDGQTDRLTDEKTDICDCRVAFATEKLILWHIILSHPVIIITFRACILT